MKRFSHNSQYKKVKRKINIYFKRQPMKVEIWSRTQETFLFWAMNNFLYNSGNIIDLFENVYWTVVKYCYCFFDKVWG